MHLLMVEGGGGARMEAIGVRIGVGGCEKRYSFWWAPSVYNSFDQFPLSKE